MTDSYVSDRSDRLGLRGEADRSPVAASMARCVQIMARGESDFFREELISFCEGHGVDYVFGLARNARLVRIVGRPLRQAQLEH
jgi:hypothetical protein